MAETIPPIPQPRHSRCPHHPHGHTRSAPASPATLPRLLRCCPAFLRHWCMAAYC